MVSMQQRPGDRDSILRLAREGADLNARDSNGRTPLHVAAFQGHGAAAQALIAVGADPGLLDNQRYDAVTITAVRGDVPSLKALLAAGASAKLITSVYDGTALIAAAHLGHDGLRPRRSFRCAGLCSSFSCSPRSPRFAAYLEMRTDDQD
jgi:ankyrin repeat protein